MHKDKTDEQICSLLQAGNKDVYGEIIERYEAKMTRYARRFFRDVYDIEDLVQDVFVKAYININSFDTSMKFNPWIYRIAHNIFVNKIAWKSIRNYIPIDADEFLPHTLPSPENTQKESMQREEKDILEKYLNRLDEKYKTPIILFFYEDMSYNEISEILKIPSGTVGIRIKRGKEKLKDIIKNTDHFNRLESYGK